MHYKQAYMTTDIAFNVQAFCDYSTRVEVELDIHFLDVARSWWSIISICTHSIVNEMNSSIFN